METYFGKPQENFLSDEINEAVMRNTIRNIREVIKNPNDLTPRSELMWASAMAENGILKISIPKKTEEETKKLIEIK